MKNTWKHRYLTILTIVTIICIVIGCLRFWGKIWWWNDKADFSVRDILEHGNDGSSKEENGMAYNVDEGTEAFTVMEIDMDTANVIVKAGSEYRLTYVSGKKQTSQFNYAVENGKLVVKQTAKKYKSRIGSFKSPELVITVPEDVQLEKADILLDMGNVSLSDTSVKDTTLSSEMGNITAEHAVFETVTLETDMGNVTMDSSAFTAAAILNTDMGNVIMNQTTFTGTANLNTGMGNVDITSCEDMNDVKMTLKTDMGVVKVNGEKKSRNYSQAGTGDRSMEAKSDMGNVTVQY